MLVINIRQKEEFHIALANDNEEMIYEKSVVIFNPVKLI